MSTFLSYLPTNTRLNTLPRRIAPADNSILQVLTVLTVGRSAT